MVMTTRTAAKTWYGRCTECALFAAPACHAGAANSAHSVQRPYLVFAAVLVVMTIALRAFRLPEARAERTPASDHSAWAHAPLAFGALAIFVYVGAEVAIGSLLVNFLGEPSIGALDAKTAASWVSVYWGGAMIGRFTGAAILR